MSCAGLFLSCLYYRISRWLRILLTIAIPVMLFVGVPTLLSFLPRDGVQELIRAALSILGNSWMTAGLCAVLGALFAAFGWISARNAALMRNPQPSASAGWTLRAVWNLRCLPGRERPPGSKTPGGLLL